MTELTIQRPEEAVLSVIHAHRSIRRYRPDPVPREMIERIVAAGQRASTSSNLQTYSVVAVTDPSKRERLSELCGNQRHIREAPVFLAFCADLARLERVCELRGYTIQADHLESFLVAAIDAALVIQTAVLAAEAMGLGACMIGGIRNNPREVIKLLDLPRLVFPVVGLTLGWPAEEPVLKPRLPLRAVLHWERYDTSHMDEDLLAYDRTMMETGIYAGRQVSVPGKPGEVEEYGWLEHSARRASSTAPGALRAHLRETIQEQGFGLK
ncbi:MAG: NADPH-dependent oxidoreductase [Anaerolineae bacterium]